MFRLCFLIAVAALIVACSSTETTRTPSTTLTPTVATRPCTVDELMGGLVGSAEQGAPPPLEGSYTVLILQVVNTADSCTLLTPPEISWYDADDVELDIPFTSSATCAPNVTSNRDCIYGSPIQLPEVSSIPTLGRVDVAAEVKITHGTPGACGDGEIHSIGLLFRAPSPGATRPVRIELPQDYEFETCWRQASFQGYGPSRTGFGL
jgi:hypothetical protein